MDPRTIFSISLWSENLMAKVQENPEIGDNLVVIEEDFKLAAAAWLMLTVETDDPEELKSTLLAEQVEQMMRQCNGIAYACHKDSDKIVVVLSSLVLA